MRKTSILMALIISTTCLFSQTMQRGDTETVRLSERASASIITILPGTAVYSAFGHTAIRIQDPVLKIDVMFNYGQSEAPFDASFVPKFVSGNMRFILGVTDTDYSFMFYSRYENRTIWEQELDLSNEELQGMFAYLAKNAREENRSYIYDFFFDNCATRVRDMVEGVFGTAVPLKPDRREQLTFREEITPYLLHQPWLKFGIDVVLGSPTDAVADDRASFFLPLHVMEGFKNATVRTDGIVRPLVKKTTLVYESTRVNSSGWWESPLIPTSAILVLAFLLAFRKKWTGTGNAARIADSAATVFDVVLFLLAGFLGSAVLILISFSGYEVTYWNMNLLWLLPTHLAAAFIILFRKRLVKSARLRKIASAYFAIAAILPVILSVAKPLLPQDIPLAAVPLMLVIAVRSADRFREIRVQEKQHV